MNNHTWKCVFKWCFINKVREEHDQTISLAQVSWLSSSANHLVEHNPCIYIYSQLTSVPWQFSSIPPPSQLLSLNLISSHSWNGREFSGFGLYPELGALPLDSIPNMLTNCSIKLYVSANLWNDGDQADFLWLTFLTSVCPSTHQSDCRER